jgi:hypothetical protein
LELRPTHGRAQRAVGADTGSGPLFYVLQLIALVWLFAPVYMQSQLNKAWRAGSSSGLELNKAQRARKSSASGRSDPVAVADNEAILDLQRRREQLNARVAELLWDLGGLAYEMAIRNNISVDVLMKRAALVQDADAELAETERILRLEQTSTAGECASCGSPHSSGAAYCWQCGQPLLPEVHSDAIIAS